MRLHNDYGDTVYFIFQTISHSAFLDLMIFGKSDKVKFNKNSPHRWLRSKGISTLLRKEEVDVRNV